MGFHAFGSEDAPVLLMLHGAHTTWDRGLGTAIPVLAERFRVIAYGSSGFDPTEQSTYHNARAEAERILAYIRDELGGALDCLYAHSLGCHPATYVAHDPSVRVGVTVLDGGVYLNTGSLTWLMARLEEPMGRLLASDTFRRLARTSLVRVSGDVSDLIYRGASRTSYENTAWSNLAWVADLHTLEPRPAASVHCWWGQGEARLMRPTVRFLKRVFPRLETKQFAGLGHGELLVDQPDRLADELHAVVAGVRTVD